MEIMDSLWVSNTESQLSELNCKLDSLQFQIYALQAKSEILTEIIETSNGSIANQLTAAGILLAVIGIIIAIIGGFIGFYIRRKKCEVEAMVNSVNEKKETVDKIAKTTKSLDKQIHSNLKDLYHQLRHEETDALLDRLILEPRDIVNLSYPLLARDLEDDGFAKLREAYLKYRGEPLEELETDTGYILPKTYDEDFILLLFQHFCYQSVKDDQIRSELIMGFEDACKKAFKRDIIKSTIDLCKALTEETSTFNKEDVLTAYLKALNKSQYKSSVELKNILEQNILPYSLLQNSIHNCTNDGVYLSLFGISKPEDKKTQPTD